METVSQNTDQRNLAILTHISGIFFGFLGPLLVYLLASDHNTKEHAKLALNWQISLILYVFIATLLSFVLIGIFILIALVIMNIIFCIMATVKASNNILWRYPASINILK